MMMMLLMVCTPGKWRLHVSSVEEGASNRRGAGNRHHNHHDHDDADDADDNDHDHA